MEGMELVSHPWYEAAVVYYAEEVLETDLIDGH